MLRKFALTLVAVWAICPMGLAGEGDDYFRLARLSYLDGHVSFQHSGNADWSAASINMPLQPGDRIYTSNDGRAEVEFDDGSVYRLAEKTDVEILSLKEDLIQVRVLLGLSTLTVRSGINFEVDTPTAAFNTMSKGIYRFDVVESGDTDAIVRNGVLEAANDEFTRQLESGDVLHIIPGDQGNPQLSSYDQRDQWDDWNDRRNADIQANNSRAYIPDSVYMGVSELDGYGRWVTVDTYGPAWVPYGVDSMWSPYWEGRWCYRPFWGWTWVSYEPWGWLPYHYGRWYRSASFGWCWLPGASFSFNFWSPGLVRFYNGPGWVSWCPLGPHDYYNVNNFYFNRSYAYQLNNLRSLQTRGPNDLINRNEPGAFRTVTTTQFVGSSFGGRGRVDPVAVDQPWSRGQIVTDKLGIQPVARSYAPAPDRPAIRPSAEPRLPTVVRSEPAVRTGGQGRVVRITNRNVPPLPSPRLDGRGGAIAPPAIGRESTTPGRDQRGNSSITQPVPRQASPGSGSSGKSTTEQPGSLGRSPGRGPTVQPIGPQRDRGSSPPDASRNRGRDNPGSSPVARPAAPPAPAPRMERPPAQERKPESDRPKQESKPRNERSDSSTGFYSNSYSAENVQSVNAPAVSGPRTVAIGGGGSAYGRPGSGQTVRQPESPASRVPVYSRGGGYAAPSDSRGSWTSPSAFGRDRVVSAPPAGREGSFGGGFARSAPSRAQSAPAGDNRRRER
ncbi:MAG TPA: DUF6600 domain-containing protein [Acidobacteriota bacterium]|nr:DUF6600 domain-containing protein [Acidobacteriota bacterium]